MLRHTVSTHSCSLVWHVFQTHCASFAAEEHMRNTQEHTEPIQEERSQKSKHLGLLRGTGVHSFIQLAAGGRPRADCDWRGKLPTVTELVHAVAEAGKLSQNRIWEFVVATFPRHAVRLRLPSPATSGRSDRPTSDLDAGDGHADARPRGHW